MPAGRPQYGRGSEAQSPRPCADCGGNDPWDGLDGLPWPVPNSRFSLPQIAAPAVGFLPRVEVVASLWLTRSKWLFNESSSERPMASDQIEERPGVSAGADGLSEADGSLLKFLARGTLAIIAWMDGSPTLQLADLQQAIRVLAWGTSVTTTAHPVLPSSSKLVDAIAAWQKAKNA